MESIKYIVDAWYNEATAFYSCKAFEYMRYICIHRAPIIRTSQKQGPSITANAFASFETNDFPMETYQNQHTHTHTHKKKYQWKKPRKLILSTCKKNQSFKNSSVFIGSSKVSSFQSIFFNISRYHSQRGKIHQVQLSWKCGCFSVALNSWSVKTRKMYVNFKPIQ